MSSRFPTVPTSPARSRSPLLLLLLLAGATDGLAAQEAQAAVAPTESAYSREVFVYDQAGRTDPFRSLLGTPDLGIRFEDLTLRGLIYNPDQRRSVAVFMDGSTDRRLRMKVGERVGGITVVAVYPRRVDVRVDEFGVARRETLYIKSPAEVADSVKGGGR